MASREGVATFLTVLTALLIPSATRAFQVSAPLLSLRQREDSSIQSWAAAAAASADEVTSSLERAKALLEKSKQKLAAKENGSTRDGASSSSSSPLLVDVSLQGNKASSTTQQVAAEQQPIPFFASLDVPPSSMMTSKRQRVIKTINEQTGLITTDGEKMAKLSEEEEWEVRPLLEVFDNETEDNNNNKDASYSVTKKQLASRDVAASIWNLRKTLQTQDYQRIFDKKNRFIGEDN